MAALVNTSSGGRRTSPGKRRPPAITVPQDGRWQPLSPCTADRLLGQGMGNYEEPLSPGGSPRFSSRRRPDSRRAILLYMTFANLFLALVLLILGGAGPGYPGHSGTVDNSYFSGTGLNRKLTTQDSPLYEDNCPTSEVDIANDSILHSALVIGLVIWLTQPFSAYTIFKQVDRRGAAATLLTSVVCAFTSLGAFAMVTLDVSYIAGCCSLMEDNCEVSNLCTQFVDDCCIGDSVKTYCGNPSYHVGAVSMIFLVFVSTSAMLVMSGTMACRCWLESDPEKQALMMVLAGTPSIYSPGASPSGSLSPRFFSRSGVLKQYSRGASPSRSGRNTPLSSSNHERRGTNSEGLLVPSRLPPQSPEAGENSSAPGGGSRVTRAEAKSTRETCPVCSAVFGDVEALVRHVDRFHIDAQKRTSVIGKGEDHV